MKCSKVAYNQSTDLPGDSPRIIIGIKTGEDDFFIFFKTSRTKYTIGKKNIISIEELDVEFDENYGKGL